MEDASLVPLCMFPDEPVFIIWKDLLVFSRIKEELRPSKTGIEALKILALRFDQ